MTCAREAARCHCRMLWMRRAAPALPATGLPLPMLPPSLLLLGLVRRGRGCQRGDGRDEVIQALGFAV